MADLWTVTLPVLQEINAYGGNLTSAFICRAVIDEINRLADIGDAAMVANRARMERLLRSGTWPSDAARFNLFFEAYYEAVFYIAATRRGVPLQHISEVNGRSTADFRTTQPLAEQFEVKTIDLATGAYAYDSIMEEGLDALIAAASEAQRRRVGMSERVIALHGRAKDNLVVLDQVMRKLSGNVKPGQFTSSPTFLVAPLIRTGLRSGVKELCPLHHDDVLGGTVSGHLWTIAAHHYGGAFFDATLDDDAHHLGALQRAGILRDCPFVRGIIFLDTEWSHLPGCDGVTPFPEDAFTLLGVWNGAFTPGEASDDNAMQNSAFARLCHSYTSMTM